MMRICPDCHAQVPERASVCGTCGYPFASGAVEPRRVAAPVEHTVVSEAKVGTCSACGYQNVPGEMFCQNCGVQLAPVASLPPPLPRAVLQVDQSEAQPGAVMPATLKAAPKPRLRLEVLSSNTMIILDMDRNEWLIGRADPLRGVYPEVDLSDQGGEESGVSRRHARLVSQEGRRFIQDLNSTNFTFLNGEKLQPGNLYPLRHGDEIRLGLLAVNYFEENAP
jgi:hypothetical protein